MSALTSLKNELKEQKEETFKKIIKGIMYYKEGNVVWFTSKHMMPNEWQFLKLLDEGYTLGFDSSKQSTNKEVKTNDVP